MFISTRGYSDPTLSFLDVVQKGLSPDGGLFVPTTLPKVSSETLETLQGKSYEQRAHSILSHFDLGIKEDELQEMIKSAYSSFFHEKRSPVTPLSESTSLLELFHGPTASFKDMALQLTPHFFAKSQTDPHQKFCIVTATSGDTGIAAVEGFRKQKNISVVVLYPKNGVSPVQKQQMQSVAAKNVKILGVDGDFDFCQSAVKQLFNDESFSTKIQEKYQTQFSAANSMNWGRLLPQVVYYFSAYADLLESGKITMGEEIEVCVPSGNFGNILGAYIAKQMGLPVSKFICASNENNVLTDFINTGIYDIRNRDLHYTDSPSIDILKSSNTERFLYWITGGNTDKIKEWFEDLNTTGIFAVDDHTKKSMQELFFSGFATEEEMQKTVKQYSEQSIILDPHTAVAVHVSNAISQKNHRIITATAHYDKFPKAMEKIIAVPEVSHPNLKTVLQSPAVQTESITAQYETVLQNIESFLQTQ